MSHTKLITTMRNRLIWH